MVDKKKKSEISIVSLCLLGIAICFYLLNTPTFLDPKDRSNEVVLGEINDITADVRLKTNKQYFWQKTQRYQSLNEGDSLFTGPKSSSEITLLDGKKIQISENSLIRFTTKNRQLSVDLAFGKLFSTGSTQPLVISDCGKLYTIEPNNATFELSKGKNCGSMDINVSQGTIKLNKKSVAKKKIQPPQNQSIFTAFVEDLQPSKPLPVAPTEQLVEAEPPKVKINPPQFERKLYNVVLSKTSRLDLTWNAVPEAKEYILEQSETETFDRKETTHIPNTTFSFKPERDGFYFFRVKTIGENGTESIYGDPAKASLTYPQIELGQREIKAEYQARTSKDLGTKRNFPITWTSVPHAVKYVVEVDNNSAFTNPVPTVSRKPAASIDVPKTGVYHYRVAAFNQQGRRISSSETPGEIIYKKMFNMVTPAIEPALKSMSFYFQKQFGQFIWLRWLKISSSNELKYRVQLASTTNFDQLYYDQLTNENKILLNKNLLQGDYFWRVRSEKSTQFSDWSDLGSLKIQTQSSKVIETK